jgi:hypothetical protein
MSTEMYLKVTLHSDPTVVVWVRTTEANQGTKRRAIQGDISYQRFPRWAPFAHPAEYDIRAYHLDQTTEYMLCHGSVNGHMVQES